MENIRRDMKTHGLNDQMTKGVVKQCGNGRDKLMCKIHKEALYNGATEFQITSYAVGINSIADIFSRWQVR